MPKEIKIYTLGYSGRKLDEIVRLAHNLNAEVWDIRYSPRSRSAQWNGSRLAEALGTGFYRHVLVFGNASYTTPGMANVRIVDMNAGLALVERAEKDIILMCACADSTHCHRSIVADELRKRGYDVQELGTISQPALL